MLFLRELWVPILVSAGATFVVALLVRTVLPLHKREWKHIPQQSDVLEAMRRVPLAPGLYMLPHIIDQDLGRADLKAALAHGPIAFIAVAKNGVPAVVGRWLALLLFFLTVNTVVAYASWHAFSVLNSGLRHMPLRIPFGHVARVVFATASLAYAGAAFQESVWHGRPWSSFVLTCVDAVIYAGISAVIFGLFWPM